MADIIFLLDSSISQTEENFRNQLAFINRFVDHVVIDEKNFRVGVVTFSFKAQLEISLTDYGDNVTLKEATWRDAYTSGVGEGPTACQGYIAEGKLVALTCDECFWNTLSDVTFLLDMRSGISDLDFSQAVDALTYLLTDTLNQKYNVTLRLSLVSYGDGSVQIHRHLTDTASNDSLIQYIQTLT
ncbi:hypothetical protein MAR_003624, partial [Mya arenaria]